MSRKSKQPEPGRDKSTGRFTKGNTAAKGNPYTRKAAAFRKILYDSVSEKNFEAICNKMVWDAFEGGARERELLLNRLLGVPGTGIDLLERIERLEAQLQAEQKGDDPK